jgi:hypothetical protein
MGRLRKEHFQKLLSRHKDFRPGLYIETGLYKGEGLIEAAPFFDQVHGIELKGHWYTQAEKAVKRMPHVKLHLGDSRELLARLLASMPDEDAFIYHDAHYCRRRERGRKVPALPREQATFPLWHELEAVRERETKDIVVVDDVHAFGRNRPDLKQDVGYEGWETVTFETLDDFFSGQLVDSMSLSDTYVIFRDGTA